MTSFHSYLTGRAGAGAMNTYVSEGFMRHYKNNNNKKRFYSFTAYTSNAKVHLMQTRK